MQRIVALGVTGLTKSDLALRLYADATRMTALEDDVLVDEEGVSGDYAITLPDDRSFYTLTYEYPAGVSSTLRFGGYDHPTAAPTYVVIGLRTTGLTLADVDVALYLDGVLRNDVLTLAELVAAGGDYALSGWPTARDNAYAGTWTLRYTLDGFTYVVTWRVPLTPTSAFVLELLDLFLDEVFAVPGATDEFGTFVPSGTILALPCRIEGEQRLVRDPSGQTVTSSVLVIVAGFNDLTVEEHRYQLPARYEPNGIGYADGGLRAIAVDKVSDDETTELYEELLFA